MFIYIQPIASKHEMLEQNERPTITEEHLLTGSLPKGIKNNYTMATTFKHEKYISSMKMENVCDSNYENINNEHNKMFFIYLSYISIKSEIEQ